MSVGVTKKRLSTAGKVKLNGFTAQSWTFRLSMAIEIKKIFIFITLKVIW